MNAAATATASPHTEKMGFCAFKDASADLLLESKIQEIFARLVETIKFEIEANSGTLSTGDMSALFVRKFRMNKQEGRELISVLQSLGIPLKLKNRGWTWEAR